MKNQDLTEYLLQPAQRELHNPEFSIQLWAKTLRVSRSSLHRLVKEHIGKSPQAYLCEIRIEKAKQYLDLGYTTTETAEQCGFNQTSYFSRLFKKMTGVNPSNWKKRNQC